MASEVTVQLSLTITKGNLQWRSPVTGFSADLVGSGKGPTPGAITVSTTGTDVDLSQLTDPGWVHMHNLDLTNYVRWGVYDPETDVFTPVGVLRPGKGALFELAPEFGSEFGPPATGTGTTGPTNRLRMRADVASCDVQIFAFES
jgi:hypothetical protein